MSAAPLLEGKGLALVRGGRLLFEQLDLALAAGEGLHLKGPNGSGKTSLIRVLAGLLQPSLGLVHRRTSIALADEHAALDRELPLGQALDFWRGPSLAPAMTALGLDPLTRVPCRFLSAGQLKRAALARVIASGSPLWLLDEPLNGLDSDSAERLDAALAAHRAMGGAVVLASHSLFAGQWRGLELGA